MYTREWMARDIGGRLKGWMAMGGILPSDSYGHLGVVIDEIFRQLSVQDADIPTAQLDPANILAFRALSTYYTLHQVQDMMGPLVDITAHQIGVAKPRSQAAAQLEERIKKADWAASKYIIFGPKNWEAGMLQLDITEPRDPLYARYTVSDIY